MLRSFGSPQRPRPRHLSFFTCNLCFFTCNRIQSSARRKTTAAPAPSQNMCMFVMVLSDSRFYPPPPWCVLCRHSHRCRYPQAIRSPSRIARSNSHEQMYLESPPQRSLSGMENHVSSARLPQNHAPPACRREASIPAPHPHSYTIFSGTPRARLCSGTSAGELVSVQEQQLGDRHRRELVKPVSAHVPE